MPTRGELRESIGQTLIMGFDGAESSPRLRTMLGLLQPAGVILFQRNLQSAAQTHTLLQECRRAVSTPMFLCVDLEGGLVDRLRQIVLPAPAVGDVAASGDKRLYRRHGQLIGREVRALGFNTDFAPVLDLGLERSRAVMRTRSASADPQQVIAYGREFLAGLKQAGVLGCGKHYPGLGEGTLDSHEHLPVIDKGWKALWNEDLLPFRELRAEMPMVMVAHAAYPHVTGDQTPASLSTRWMVEILRRRIRFGGLVLSDDLDMAGVLAAGSLQQAAVGTLRAGADIYLVCQKEESVWLAFEAVLREAERDRRFARLVLQAARRVLRFKQQSREIKRPVPAPSLADVERLRAEMLRFSDDVTARRQVAERAQA